MRAASAKMKQRIGALMMVGALATGVAAALHGPALAQEPEEEQEEATPAETERDAFYAAKLHEVIPPTVISEFPPGVACIISPELCGEQTDPISDAVEPQLEEAQASEPDSPEDPIPPDTLPVSITAGNPRYQSAIQFTLPSVAEGQQVDSFEVVLTETDPTGNASSPFVRQAVLAGMTCARECDQAEFEKLLTKDCEGNVEDGAVQPCPAENDPLDVEACPIVGEWEEGRSQPAENVPEVDCLYGANGQRQEDGTWVFDLTFALQAWSDGEIEPNGVLLRPGTAPNFAFGDPDSTFNKQVSFENQAAYRVATSEAPEPVSLDAPSFDDAASTGGSSGDLGAPATTGGGTADNGGFSFSGGQPGGDAEPSPDVAAPAAGDTGDAGATQAPSEPLAAGATDAPAQSAWWIWLLVPVFAGGMYTMAQSLTAPVAAAAERQGAMSRLIAKRNGTTSGPELVQF